MKRDVRNNGALALILFYGSACFPYVGRSQLPVPSMPLIVLDSRTFRHLQRVLIIPRYSSFKGASSGAGHGPSVGSDRCYLAHPFVYEHGTPFKVNEAKAVGVVWGLGSAFSGQGISLDGVTVVARGYEPLWFYDLWNQQGATRRQPIELARIPDAETESRTRQLLTLLRQPRISDAEARQFGYCGGEVSTQFTARELRMIEEFIDRAP